MCATMCVCVCVCVCAQGTAVGRLLECLRSGDKQTVRYAAGALRNIAVEESGRHQVSKLESAKRCAGGGAGSTRLGTSKRARTLTRALTRTVTSRVCMHAQTGGGGARGACQAAGANIVAGRFHCALCVGLPQESQHCGGALMYTRGGKGGCCTPVQGGRECASTVS